ncbi:MAG: CocE/NonD family hydrolase, partial [Planctomycetota bacterium]
QFENVSGPSSSWVCDTRQMKYLGDLVDPKAPGNEWRSAESWPPPNRPRSYFLQPNGKLSRDPVSSSTKTETAITYSYDPKDPVPTKGGNNLIFGGRGPVDQRGIKDRKDYLRFVSDPLERAVEMAGRVRCQLFVDSDAPDTDFVAKLIDVYPDGYEALVLDGIIRARYREGLMKEIPLEKGKVVTVEIDLWSTAYAFHQGHKISVHITSSNDPRFDPNPNTGDATRANDEKRVAKNTVHFSAARPSRILLPILRDGSVEPSSKKGGGKRERN